MSTVPTPTQVRDVFDTLGPPGTPFTTPEVAEEFDCTDRTIYNRLDTLVEDGVLETKKVGARGRVWWRPVDERGESENQFIGNESLHTALESRIDQLCERNIGVYTVDTELRFTYCNDQAEAWLGTTETQLRDEFVWDAFNYMDIADEAYHEALDLGEPTNYLNYDESLEGWFENRVYPTDSGLTVYFTDVTARKEAERELRERKQESEAKYRTLFESIDEGFCILEVLFDKDDEPVDFRLLETNPAFEEQTGFVDAEGKRIRDLVPNHEEHWFEIFGRVAKTGEPERFTERAEHLGDRWYDLYAFRIGDPEVRNVAVLFDDITERKRAEDELERARDLLANSGRIADVGGWELDTETRDLHWTDHMFDLMGVPADEEPSLEGVLSGFHEEDRPALEDAVETALESGEPYDIEARYRRNGGDELRWLKNQGDPNVVDGEVTTLRGAVQDITERKRREEDLRETKEKLEIATTAGDVGLWTRDMKTDIVSGDAFLAETYGMDPEAVAAGSPLEEFIQPVHEADRDRVWEAIEQAVKETDEMAIEYRVQDAKGNWRWAEARATMEYDEHGEQVRLNGTMIDVTERKRREEELREQAERDAFRVKLTDAIRSLSDPVEIQHQAARVIGQHLGVSHAHYADVRPESGVTVVNADYYRDGVSSVVGEHHFEDYGQWMLDALQAGDTIVVDDIEADPMFDAKNQATHEQIDIRALVVAPLHKDGGLTGFFTIDQQTPREWTDAEVAMVEKTVQRTWGAVERARSEAELAAELEATRELQEVSTELIQEDDVESLAERVLDAAVGIVDADCATVQLYDPERNDLDLTAHRGLNEAAEPSWDRVTPEEGTSCARALETGERVVVEDVETCEFLAGTDDQEIYLDNGIRAVQTTPLVSRSGDLLGMFSTHWETPRDLLERELGHLDILARQTVDLIEHQQTMEALRESEGKLQRLNTTTRELIEATPDEIRDHAADLVQRVLNVEYTALWRYDETTGELEEFIPYSEPEPDADAIRIPNGGTDQIWQSFIGEGIIVSNNLAADEHGVPDQLLRSQLLIPLGRHGIVCAGSLQPNEFDERTVEFAETLGSTLETAWDRAESEQELAHQNDELERLDELNSLIRQIDQALVHADTRDEIDEAVCNKLAESTRYAFAWIGAYDAETDAVTPWEWTGVDSRYLVELTESLADSATDDPITTALQTYEVQVIGDIATDARAASWREGALERGARSCLHIPLVHDQSLYGILSVYGTTPRPDERETEVLAEFGQTISHTINAVETKTVLQTDGTVELTLRIDDANTALSCLARNANAGIDVEGFVPGSDEGLTVFFTARGASPADLSGAAESALGIEDLTCLIENEDEALFRAQLTDSASDSVFVMQDAVVRSITIDADTATFVVDLPHEVSVSTFLDDLRGRVPDVELLARQPRHRPLQTRYSLQLSLPDRLTPRQLEILQLAYRSGFFESPRVRTGKELSETLDIAHSTFTYHLREAERRLCEMAFEAT